jgi:ADP-heptose:LPS heptosyltransferase
LRAARYDGAVVFTVCTQSALPAALMLLLAGVPRRLAYARENPYDLLTDWLPDPDRDVRAGVRHEVQRQLDLVAHTGAMARDARLCYPVTELDSQAMLAKARAAGADCAKPWIVVHPGATAASRRYPLPSLAAAVAQLAAQESWQLVFAGGDEDRASVAALARRAPTGVRLSGELSFGELAALIERARVVVCNNSSPAHLCAAVGTPVVDLYALTNPQHTPWGVANRTLSFPVPCRGCLRSTCPELHHRCLAGVSPDEVVDAVRAMYDAPVAHAA